MAVPYTFGTATSSIPLSQLDSNFNTVITLGNTAIQLGNTVTTLNNMTLANVTISSGNVTITNVAITTANVTTANITTAVIGTETVTTSTITTANVTTANITTDNITNGTVITSLTLSYGTANGVAYLNGSKVLTTGSALSFDGSIVSNTGVGFNVNNANALYRFQNGSGTRTGYLQVRSDAFEIWSDQSTIPMIFGTSNAEQMRLTSTGLGIGTTSPAYKLDVLGTQRIYQSSNTAASISLNANQGALGTGYLFNLSQTNSSGGYAFTISEASTTYLTLTNSAGGSGGNLGIGVVPSAWSSDGKVLELPNGVSLFGNTGSSSSYLFTNAYYNGTNFIYKTTRAASYYNQQNGIHAWAIAPSGTAGNAITFTQAMTLAASGGLSVGNTTDAGVGNINISGTYKSNGVDLISSDGSSNYLKIGSTLYIQAGSTTKAVIDSSGNLLVGVTADTGSPNNGVTIRNSTSGTIGNIGIGHASGVGSGNAYMAFAYAGTQIGSITQSGTTAVLFNTTSDQRLKENIQDAESASALIDSLQVRQFDWKTDNTHQRYGFIAQELVTVAPEAVHQPVNEDDMMAVDYSKLVPMLVKEIQSLRKRLADAGIA